MLNNIILDEIKIGDEDKKLIDDLSKLIIKDFIIEFDRIELINKEKIEPIIKSLIDKYKTNLKVLGNT